MASFPWTASLFLLFAALSVDSISTTSISTSWSYYNYYGSSTTPPPLEIPPSNAIDLQCGASKTGTIANGERIVFKMDNVRSRDVTFSSCNSAAGVDTMLFLADSSGTWIRSADCYSANCDASCPSNTYAESFTVMLSADSTYYLLLTPYRFDNGGAYEIRTDCGTTTTTST